MVHKCVCTVYVVIKIVRCENAVFHFVLQSPQVFPHELINFISDLRPQCVQRAATRFCLSDKRTRAFESEILFIQIVFVFFFFTPGDFISLFCENGMK